MCLDRCDTRCFRDYNKTDAVRLDPEFVRKHAEIRMLYRSHPLCMLLSLGYKFDVDLAGQKPSPQRGLVPYQIGTSPRPPAKSLVAGF